MDDKTDMKAFNSQDKAPETEKEQEVQENVEEVEVTHQEWLEYVQRRFRIQNLRAENAMLEEKIRVYSAKLQIFKDILAAEKRGDSLIEVPIEKIKELLLSEDSD